jgi:hypothetical protein
MFKDPFTVRERQGLHIGVRQYVWQLIRAEQLRRARLHGGGVSHYFER